jgi:hypothetical protein
LERLESLSGTQLAAVPGHRATLERLGAVARDTAGVTLSLATAVAAFPSEASGSDLQPAAEAAHQIRTHRHRAIRDALTQAALTMEVCETACRNSATALARDTAALPAPSASPAGIAPAPAPAADALPKLTPAQQAALRAIGAGGVRMYQSGRNGPLRISASAGARITMPTYDRLESFGLVKRDTSSGFYGGQKLYATDAGRTALAALNTTATTRLPAPAASPGARRR